jgi:hypothetical protein
VTIAAAARHQLDEKEWSDEYKKNNGKLNVMMNYELPVVPNNVTCVSSNLTALSLSLCVSISVVGSHFHGCTGQKLHWSSTWRGADEPMAQWEGA